jgi:hypothetical protein
VLTCTSSATTLVREFPLENSMARKIVVLGTYHQLQGTNFTGYVDDPSYTKIVSDQVRFNNIDYIFEEASGHGPSIAEKQSSQLGPDRYFDIDPCRADRTKFGIPENVESCGPVDPCKNSDVLCLQDVDGHRLREELWIQRISGKNFKVGLMICGVAHGLSMGFRLQNKGFEVELLQYVPSRKI